MEVNMKKTAVIAHRGSKGTRPENTLSSFEEAIAVNSDGIELDVHLTKDQQLIVIHDEKVDRTTNGQGYVKDKTMKELKQLDAGSSFSALYKGEKLPALSEVLDLLSEQQFKGLLNIELKTDICEYPGIEQKVLQLVNQEKRLYQLLYSSFNYKSLNRLKDLEPETEIALILKKVGHKDEEWLKNKYSIDAWHPKFNWWDKSGKELFPGQLVRPWTVNHLKELDICFNYPTAGVMTDYPEKALKRRSKWQ